MDLLINHYYYIIIIIIVIIIIITSEHFETPWENSLSYASWARMWCLILIT